MELKASVDTLGGVLCIGDTWDAALPKLQTGVRIHLERIGPDCWKEVRHLGVDLAAFLSQSYELTWERSSGPYTLVRIRQLDPEVL